MRRKRYDAVVAGGGLAGMMHACALAESGRKVLIADSGTSLAHEIGLSRMPVAGMRELADRYPLFQSWLNELSACGALKGERMDQVRTQLLADRFVRDRGVDVLFETFPVELLRDGEGSETQVAGASGDARVTGVRFATREGMRVVACDAVADCTESAVLASQLLALERVNPSELPALWTLTFLKRGIPVEGGGEQAQDGETIVAEAARSKGDLRHPESFSFDLGSAHFECLVQPAFREEEYSVMTAVYSPDGRAGTEIGFTAMLEQVYTRIKSQVDTLLGPLLHVSEKCWTAPRFVCSSLLAGRVEQRNAAWLETSDGSFAVIGCWTMESRRIIKAAGAHGMGGEALRLQVDAAMEAARAVRLPG